MGPRSSSKQKYKAVKVNGKTKLVKVDDKKRLAPPVPRRVKRVVPIQPPVPSAYLPPTQRAKAVVPFLKELPKDTPDDFIFNDTFIIREIQAYKEFTPRQRLFLTCFLRRGYSLPRACAEIGVGRDHWEVYGRLIEEEPARSIIHEHKEAAGKLFTASPRRVVEELESIAFNNIGDFIRIDVDGNPRIDFTAATRKQLAGVQEMSIDETTDRNGHVTVKTKFKLYPKSPALELLGKYFTMFVDRHEFTGPDGAPLLPPTLIVQVAGAQSPNGSIAVANAMIDGVAQVEIPAPPLMIEGVTIPVTEPEEDEEKSWEMEQRLLYPTPADRFTQEAEPITELPRLRKLSSNIKKTESKPTRRSRQRDEQRNRK